MIYDNYISIFKKKSSTITYKYLKGEVGMSYPIKIHHQATNIKEGGTGTKWNIPPPPKKKTQSLIDKWNIFDSW